MVIDSRRRIYLISIWDAFLDRMHTQDVERKRYSIQSILIFSQ